ncbi:MAG: CDP-diacylglycerol--glycerol-3-phosphate 3-phosphatidyltransferase [Gammaproteobacteria bacterium]|uniref:CDP-diacylglycerol--glycerol-3-phosphate 3-phosphatidyltransferase n=1 Tax=unclassified Acidiferrobacter TaxID=2640868 RepID=UPI000D73C1E4|nr:CDP-diacylglycerol--glycerol-3-phosphate 3-phosphatidyltransferase [Acidiferrobacter sp. SPIII_3]AWP24987.1 CDP-diacylglycerol--glycerol-3-phosphate 3-phosphatidyltransferase [Acidiferrobacter sp. SPIII_3]MDA8119916.1 CDP-diacylglycerol--glycerol-3-phosphate 3-phosphatidyltransferase [Gammaproteobacteria bacterium]
MNAPNILTLLRIALIPVFVLVYFLPVSWADVGTAGFFLLAALTDWLDGYLARRWNQSSAFGAFLDPVADKLMVATALIMIVANPKLHPPLLSTSLFSVVVLVIIGREIAVSALREWMAEVGKRKSVAVSVVGKFKTGVQMVAILLLLYERPIVGVSAFRAGELLLYVAALLTLWSMGVYLKAAWPELTKGEGEGR